jgi:hypothetical protein
VPCCPDVCNVSYLKHHEKRIDLLRWTDQRLRF